MILGLFFIDFLPTLTVGPMRGKMERFRGRKRERENVGCRGREDEEDGDVDDGGLGDDGDGDPPRSLLSRLLPLATRGSRLPCSSSDANSTAEAGRRAGGGGCVKVLPECL